MLSWSCHSYIVQIFLCIINPVDLKLIFTTEKGRKCKALFSYTPSHEDELELLVGDEIHFLGEVEEGWWRGKLAGRVSSLILLMLLVNKSF